MIDSIEALRERYSHPQGRALTKQLDALDPHCTRFIALSPFIVIASAGALALDASPRGGEPGFVKVLGPGTLLIPDAPGNNRLDSFTNIAATGKIGLLFLIPGVDETLRVNGSARLSDAPELLEHFAHQRRAPKLVVEVSVAEAYLHCAKALMRSRLWAEESRQQRSVLPGMGQMINDQTGAVQAPETQEQMVARYASDL